MLIKEIARIAFDIAIQADVRYWNFEEECPTAWERLSGDMQDNFIAAVRSEINSPGNAAPLKGGKHRFNETFRHVVALLSHDPSIFRVAFTIADRLDVPGAISITADADALEAKDADGNDLPPTPAMRLSAAVFDFIQRATTEKA